MPTRKENCLVRLHVEDFVDEVSRDTPAAGRHSERL
jgi:hypothetical protein